MMDAKVRQISLLNQYRGRLHQFNESIQSNSSKLQTGVDEFERQARQLKAEIDRLVEEALSRKQDVHSAQSNALAMLPHPDPIVMRDLDNDANNVSETSVNAEKIKEECERIWACLQVKIEDARNLIIGFKQDIEEKESECERIIEQSVKTLNDYKEIRK